MSIDPHDQFGGLPMGELIGGPLTATREAQAQLANATAQFIQRMGVAPDRTTAADTAADAATPDHFIAREVAFRFTPPATSCTDDVPGGDPNQPAGLVRVLDTFACQGPPPPKA